MTPDCTYHYKKVRKFTLVKETPKAIKIRLENHPEKISIWMPKKITRQYTDTSAWFWQKALNRDKPFLGFIFGTIYLPTRIWDFFSDIIWWNRYRKCCKEVEFIKQELKNYE